MHNLCLVEADCLTQGSRESAAGVSRWKTVFLLGNHRRIVGEILCEPPTVGGKGILGVGTRVVKMRTEGKHYFCRRIVSSTLLGVQGPLRIRDRPA